MSKAELAQKEKVAGRDLDAMVAERVMGWERAPEREALYGFVYRRPDKDGLCLPPAVPNYSTDISADFSVHASMRERDPRLLKRYFDALFKILHRRWEVSDEGHTADFDCCWLYPMNFYEAGDYSRAALEAVGDTQ